MTQATAIDPKLQKAFDALAQLAREAAPVSLVWSADISATLRALCAAVRPSTEDIFLPPVGISGLAWHLDQLDGFHRAGTTLTELEAARLRYHARLLGFALAPDQPEARPEFRPLVTILIPVFNRAAPVLEAVQSCLDQTWRPIEVLVVDDGSTDDPEAGLARFGDKVRLIRKPNGGVASARNLGIELAQGDFIHFLDSDDMLTAPTIESKLKAFAAVADADICYGQDQSIDMRRSPPLAKEWRVERHTDPTRQLIVAFPFLLQQTMLPRWRLLAGPRFEEDLRRSSDFRLWQALGFAGAKVIGIPELGLYFRRFDDSLHRTPETEDDSHALALMRGFRDLALHPQAWRYGADYLNILAHERVHYWFDAAASPRVQKAVNEAIAALSRTPRSAPSPLPMLAAMHDRAAKLERMGYWPITGQSSTYRLLRDTLAAARANARSFNAQDLAFWRQTLGGGASNRALADFFARPDAVATPARQAKLADTLLRAGKRLPSRRIVRRAAKLQPWLGTKLAVKVAMLKKKHKRT